MTEQVRKLIEARDALALDALQIRGDWEDWTRAGKTHFVGFDYANQCWVEHVW